MRKNYIFILFFLYCCSSAAIAQTNRKVSGTVTDTTKTFLSAIEVMLILGQDTLHTTTDRDGNFSFNKLNTDRFSLLISTVGYERFIGSYVFEKNERHKRLADIALKLSAEMLKEVVIKGKPNPVRFMIDTVEYNVDAYRVMDGDNVADLLKQFPGMEVDDDYNVKTMGQEMVKLRVNGKDFFTSNVKDFISRLPAAIVSKIQVIDDFGDEANFTGIKVGEPVKMLNIVTKPGMNKGSFGNIFANAGTNKLIGSNAAVNLWNDERQSGGGLNANAQDNGAGNTRNIGLSVNHRDKWSKNLSGGFNYNFNNNNNAFLNEQALETINPQGNLINTTQSIGKSKNDSHGLNLTLNFNNKKVYLNGYIGAGIDQSSNENTSFSAQTGLIRQDLRNGNISSNNRPRINGNFNLSKILQNKKNSFSANIGFYTSSNRSDQQISTNTLYYNKLTGALEKDSLLNRDLISRSNSQNLNFGFNYSLGLKKLKDSLARQSLNINYSAAVSKNESEVATYVFDNLSNAVSLVDSLSTLNHSISLNQTIGLNYNYNNKTMRYNLGINARPNLLTSDYVELDKKIVNNTFTFAPNLNVSKTFDKSKTLSINYSGASANPSIYQLQPIRNTQNLQNVVIGNPDLKSSFVHNLGARYNYAHVKSGTSLQLGLNFSTTQNEIVNNVMLVPDTLNSLKQVTRYENVNGNYTAGGNYALNIPLSKNKFAINYSGTLNFSNRAIFINNERKANRGLNLSQRIGGNIMLKKFTLNSNFNFSSTNNSSSIASSGFIEGPSLGFGQITEATYFRSINYRADLNAALKLKWLSLRGGASFSSNHNNNLVGAADFGDIETYNLNLSGSFKVRKSFFIHFNSSKRINSGYTLANANVNPLILGLSLNKTFLKNNALSFTVSGSDILNQGNNISRYVMGNTVVDSRTNQPTRIFSMGLTYNLSKFGGKNYYVDQD
ncbi:MAG: outer membrane beta-barrel protein [Pedobacter sp.]|nr:outer membrane beta-barrel protein [Pedobacter sp.]MDQ8052586.1 outer membrane beta-barrel protein [Pedobacter sp.]